MMFSATFWKTLFFLCAGWIIDMIFTGGRMSAAIVRFFVVMMEWIRDHWLGPIATQITDWFIALIGGPEAWQTIVNSDLGQFVTMAVKIHKYFPIGWIIFTWLHYAALAAVIRLVRWIKSFVPTIGD